MFRVELKHFRLNLQKRILDALSRNVMALGWSFISYRVTGAFTFSKGRV